MRSYSFRYNKILKVFLATLSLAFSFHLGCVGEDLPPFENVTKSTTIDRLNIVEIFKEAPIIYSILLFLSVLALVIWLYTTITTKNSDLAPQEFVEDIRQQCHGDRYVSATKSCDDEKTLLGKVFKAGISNKDHGMQTVIESMENVCKRNTCYLWQRLDILQDIANTAPMIGLLGTVVGLFYAFYDTSRSVESLTSIFDGLGVAMGTTVAGLIVSLLSTCFCTLLRHRITSILTTLEENINLVATAICHESTKPKSGTTNDSNKSK